jgi:hypothetical protein
VEDAILDGIVNASKKFTAMSGIESLYSAPEYLVSVSVADALTCGNHSYVTLEDHVKGTINFSGGLSRGRPRGGLRITGRSDIVLWWKKGKPRAMIEVKHPLFHSGKDFENDVKRLRDLLQTTRKNGNSIQFCCLAFWTGADQSASRPASNPAAHIKRMLARLQSAADVIVARDRFKVRLIGPRIQEERTGKSVWAWSPAALVIE